MITPKEHFHGSDLEKIEAVYGIKKEYITSFSANVNPLGVSLCCEELWLPIFMPLHPTRTGNILLYENASPLIPAPMPARSL